MGDVGQYELLVKENINIKLTLNSKILLKFATTIDIKALEFISFQLSICHTLKQKQSEVTVSPSLETALQSSIVIVST